ncbi:hypothetical protein F511_20065 [Dorcoceras hygrometricum]|uniref:Uncharacterized protein n=1 Tax=Dorcoceras hygrometricum TaxID=472368 RepID=A0A2Z7DBE8_9LAMI|nr:hypothetical protein F511_20065 [Dorcoceras hygrometricum]
MLKSATSLTHGLPEVQIQKLKSERGKTSTGICEVARTCHYFAPLPQVNLQLQTGTKSKELSKTNPAPPISLQSTVEIDGNLTEKGSDEQYNQGFLGNKIRNIWFEIL